MKILVMNTEWNFFEEAFSIHTPAELPLFAESDESFEFDGGRSIEVLITPNVIIADEALTSLEFSERSCFIDGEKHLKFFKVYSKVNCEMECFSNFSKEVCGCVAFDVIRDQSTRVCSVYDEECLTILKHEMKYSKSSRRMDSCECFYPCESISYSYEFISTKMAA